MEVELVSEVRPLRRPAARPRLTGLAQSESVVSRSHTQERPDAVRLAARDPSLTMLDESVLRSIASLVDPLGILSVYVGTYPEEEAGSPSIPELEVRHGLEAIERQIEAGGDTPRAEALAARLADLRPDLDLLLSPRESGRGRALFAGLSGGDAIRVAVRLPFDTHVTLAERARVRPLARALEAGRPAGLALVSDEGLRLLEWRLGEVEELRAVPFVEAGEERRELRGPAYAHPKATPHAAPGFRTGQQRDLFERRTEEELGRFLAAGAPDVQVLARARGWEDIVVAGDDRLTEPFAHRLLDPGGPEVTVDRRMLGWLPFAELAEATAPLLDEVRTDRALTLFRRVREEALGGGRGALGLGDTLAALAQGRVERLILPAEGELSGASAPDGTLLPAGETPPGFSPEDLRLEPSLAERMIERALQTGASLTLLVGRAEEALGQAEAAALLRW